MPAPGTPGTAKTALLTPMSLVLHLGGPDLLAGARRYRARLIEQGRYRRLDEKIRCRPVGIGGGCPAPPMSIFGAMGLLAARTSGTGQGLRIAPATRGRLRPRRCARAWIAT